VALTELDRSLLELCLRSDGAAWREFVDRFAGLFAHVIHHTAQARSIQLTDSDTEDLCAEVFVAILADDFAILRRFRGESSLATYLTVIVRRIVVREVIRRRMSEAMGHVKSHTANIDAVAVKDNHHEISRIENREMVQRMLEGLSEQDATVIRQFHLEGKSYREIGERLGLPENTIGPTLSRAREKLRQGLSATYG